MKRAVNWLWVLALAAAIPAMVGQHEPVKETGRETRAQEVAEHPAEAEHGTLELWKWANFLLLAGGLGYLIGKNAGPFFTARGRKIRKDMMEAEEARTAAEKRAAEVDARLNHLAAEIEALRAEARSEEREEAERIRSATQAEIAKIQAHAEQEMAAAGKAARMELKRHAGEVALRLAEQKIRGRMDAGVEDALVQSFIHGIGDSARSATT